MQTQRRRQAGSAAGLCGLGLVGLAMAMATTMTGCLAGEALDPFEPQATVPMQKLTNVAVTFLAPAMPRADCEITSDGQGGVKLVGNFNGVGGGCALDAVLQVTVPMGATRPRLRFFHSFAATSDFDAGSMQFFATATLGVRARADSIGEVPFLFSVASYQQSNAGSDSRFPYASQEILLPIPDAAAGQELTISLEQFYRNRAITAGNPPQPNTLTWTLKTLSLEASVPVTPSH